jgi:hypothetical protein
MGKKDVSRRKFLLASTAGVGSLLVAGKLVGSIGGSSKSVYQSAPKLPWSIGTFRFDVAEVKKRAYQNFYNYECMGAVMCTFLQILTEKVGYPFNTLPLDMFRYGGGGVAGWGTICGTLNGGSQFLNLVGSPSNYQKLINDLLDWYSNQSFPSRDHDSYAKFKNQAQSEAKSPLCHVSVTTWVNRAREVDDPNIRSLSPERADRCAKVSGDVAGHIAQMINDYYDGKYIATFDPGKSEYSSCLSCHTDTENAYNPNVKAQMNCTTCHVDLNKIDLATHPFGNPQNK